MIYLVGDLPALPRTIRTASVPALRGPVSQRQRHVESPTSADPRDRSRRRPGYPTAAVRHRQNRAKRTITITRIMIIRAVLSTTESISSMLPVTKSLRKSREINKYIFCNRNRVKLSFIEAASHYHVSKSVFDYEYPCVGNNYYWIPILTERKNHWSILIGFSIHICISLYEIVELLFRRYTILLPVFQ